MNISGELIARARRGDEEAFRLIFERYTRPLISFVFYMVGRREAAEELAQETFLRAYKSIASLREDSNLSSWLFGIARNVAREWLRERGREPRRVEMDDPAVAALRDGSASPAGKLLDKELGAAVGAALGSLDEEKRLVFVLKVYQQRSYEEICEITGFSLPKVRNDLHRARAEMRRRLRRYVGENDEV
ncbi:MAG TPA: sigma-70 family RNA polymerase sigma factor [Pyrinomonadaceae bacterium]|nr:sigma-70 family RNA polymerase sigma factor [Pyrinomonadaceae bacterium]